MTPLPAGPSQLLTALDTAAAAYRLGLQSQDDAAMSAALACFAQAAGDLRARLSTSALDSRPTSRLAQTFLDDLEAARA